jgi:tagatose 6-phosphate kinase
VRGAASSSASAKQAFGTGENWFHVAILTVTLNPCVDRTYTVPDFALDHVHRPEKIVLSAGGKGINVARVYRKFGGEAAATGFLGGLPGDWLRQAVEAEGVTADFVTVIGESRTCHAIVDPIHGTQTELNETGPLVTEADVAALQASLTRLVPGRDAVVISGSMPPGTPLTLYGEIIRLAQQQHDVKTLLDTSGEALALGAEAEPFLLKPNIHELAAFGLDGMEPVEAACTLRDRYHCSYVLVTAGPKGAVLVHGQEAWQAQPPPVITASAVGSGDSLTAAFLWALENGYNGGEALRLGVAAGAANAMTYGAGIFPHALAFELARETTVNQITGMTV